MSKFWVPAVPVR